MISQYVAAVLRNARYGILPDDTSFYGEIPGVRRIYANAPALEACRE